MYSFTFANKVSLLMDRSVAEMTSEELDLWLMACEILERRTKPDRSERDWRLARLEAEAEIRRRQTARI
jgi:hypothetical protein